MKNFRQSYYENHPSISEGEKLKATKKNKIDATKFRFLLLENKNIFYKNLLNPNVLKIKQRLVNELQTYWQKYKEKFLKKINQLNDHIYTLFDVKELETNKKNKFY